MGSGTSDLLQLRVDATSRAFEYLEELKRTAAFPIECGNFAIEDYTFGWLGLQSILQLQAIERLFIA
jgi:hypothetical protein